MHPVIYSNLSELYINLIRKYNKKYPHERYSVGDYKRYFGKEKLIEILELAFGREIEFTRVFPPKGQEYLFYEIGDDISRYTFEYIGTVSKLDSRQLLIQKFYDSNLPKKFECDWHPIIYRDIIGIENTIALLEEANNRCVVMICKADEHQESISAEDLEFIIIEDDEWYDVETGKVRKDDDF